MRQYPKRIYSISDQVQSYIDAGMRIDSIDKAKEALAKIGYYRLRGYCFQWYDNSTKQYQPGTCFTDLLQLYTFDSKLSHLVFSFASQIEIALRARFIDAMIVYNDTLIYLDPAVFEEKQKYWSNLSSLSGEIARSSDVFIDHNYKNHDGNIPLWAAVEVTTFGNLSKLIKNMKTDTTGAFPILAEYYKYKSQNGNDVKPSKKILTSWIQAVSTVRNICAHNGRLYNRTIATTPELLNADRIVPQPQYNGLYQILLAMKYLRPDDNSWICFVNDLKNLISQHSNVVQINCLNFPNDWESHFTLS